MKGGQKGEGRDIRAAFQRGYKRGKAFVVEEAYEHGRTDAFEEFDRDWDNRDRRWHGQPPLPPLVRQRAPLGQPQAQTHPQAVQRHPPAPLGQPQAPLKAFVTQE